MTAIEQLLRHGGWALGDAQARHRANPDSFWLPTPEQVAAIAPGFGVKALFDVLDQADPVRDRTPPYGEDGAPNLTVQCERMWLWVERLDGEDLVGILQNLPAATHTRLVPGARIRLRRSDVIDVDPEQAAGFAEEVEAMQRCGFPVLPEADARLPEDPLRLPSIAPSQLEACSRAGVRPERPWDHARVLLGKTVGPESCPVRGVRERPRPDRRDCGWVIWTGPSDMEEAQRTDGFEIVDVRVLFARNRPAWEHLALPPGWAFVVDPNGYEDVYEEPQALGDVEHR